MSFVEWLLTVGAVLAAITGISIFTVKIYKIAKRIDGALGIDREGRTISDRLQRVEHQLFPNGGTSLVDKINRIEHDQKQMKGEMSAFKDILTMLMKGQKVG